MSTAENIDILRSFPSKLEALVTDLTPEELTTAYNTPEWTVAQNVHHLVDAHMNGYVRFKIALTEDHPSFRPYAREQWAELADARMADIRPSLTILRGMHARWVACLETIEDWSRIGIHPQNGEMTLEELLQMYANHCGSHITQIQAVLDKMPK